MYEKALKKIKEDEKCKPNCYSMIGVIWPTGPTGLIGPTGPQGIAGGTEPVSAHLVITQIR